MRINRSNPPRDFTASAVPRGFFFTNRRIIMLTIVTDRDEIARCQKQFEENLTRKLAFREERNVGFQGATVKGMPIHTSKGGDGLWFGTRDMEKPTSPEYESAFSPRYWNAFGFLKESGSLNITVEINFPHEGINNHIGGLFAKDSRTGKYFVLHRGKVGGGRPGIGKDAFRDFYDGQYKEVKQDAGFKEVMLVAGVDDPFHAVRRFVERVRDFKETVKTGKLVKPPATDESRIGFRSEFAGIKSGKRNAEFEYESYHGIVVDELRRQLSEAESGGQEFNNRFVDLGFCRGKKITSLYEVKTSCNRQSVYTGIGQLMVHSAGDKTVKKTLVLPEPDKLGAEICNTLHALGIDLLHYKRSGPRVQFYPPQ